MDVLDSISCVFLFMAAGPFLEKLFLTSAPQNYLQRPRKKESAQDRSALAGCGKTRCEALIAKDGSIKSYRDPATKIVSGFALKQRMDSPRPRRWPTHRWQRASATASLGATHSQATRPPSAR